LAALGMLRRPGYLVLIIVLTLVLAALYTNLSLRSGGMDTTIWTTSRATPAFEISKFGPTYYWSGVGLDVLAAFLTAVLVSLTIATYRTQRTRTVGSVGTAASFAVAATTFG
jgi:hypothetical protein